MMAHLLKLLPSPLSRLAVGGITVAFILGMTFLKGATWERNHWELKAAIAEAELLRAVERAARINDRVSYQYMDRWHTVIEKGKTIIKEVPRYVTEQADVSCPIPRGFVWLHDAAASHHALPGAASDPDGVAAGLTLSAVAGTVSENYTTCQGIREQLIALQGWALQVSAPGPP